MFLIFTEERCRDGDSLVISPLQQHDVTEHPGEGELKAGHVDDLHVVEPLHHVLRLVHLQPVLHDLPRCLVPGGVQSSRSKIRFNFLNIMGHGWDLWVWVYASNRGNFISLSEMIE